MINTTQKYKHWLIDQYNVIELVMKDDFYMVKKACFSKKSRLF